MGWSIVSKGVKYTLFILWLESLTTPNIYFSFSFFLHPWEMHCHLQKDGNYGTMCLNIWPLVGFNDDNCHATSKEDTSTSKSSFDCGGSLCQ